MGPKWALAMAIALAATPALADDTACMNAARDHTSFKAIISDDDSGKPQYDTVQRGSDGEVIVTRYIADQKRLVRHTLFGLFSKENEVWMGGTGVRFGMSHSIDVTKLMPLKPHSTVKYRTTTVREGTMVPQFSDVSLTVGEAHDAMIGGCKLPVIDVTVETRSPNTELIVTFKGAFSPDLAYPLDSSVEVVKKADVKTFVTKLREIQPWSETAE